MSNIKDIVEQIKANQKSYFNSHVVEGKVKMPVKDLVANYPVINISAIDLFKTDEYGDLIPVNIVEEEDGYFYAPTLLKNLLLKVIEVVGSVEMVNDMLERAPLEVKWYIRKSKKHPDIEYIYVEL